MKKRKSKNKNVGNYILLFLMCLLLLMIGINHYNINNLHKEIKKMKYSHTREVELSAYSARIQETDSTPTKTASMKRIKKGQVAVSRDLFDNGWTFGKKIYVKNLGIYEIQDLMAQKHTNKIDIVMNTKEAKKFGVKTEKVTLLN